MKRFLTLALAALAFAPIALWSQTMTVDLSKETVGKTPTAFEPQVGTWVIAQDGAGKVIKVDGAAYKAAQDSPTQALFASARKFYGTSNEELMDTAKQFAIFPIAVLRTVPNFSNGTISVKFKTVAGDADRCSGILFNVKPNGDWLTVRYNDTENNVVFWEFHNGVRRQLKRSPSEWMLDRAAWHELKLTVDGANLHADMDGKPALDYVLGSDPAPGRNGAAPNPDLVPANNPVLRPPVAGKIGLWSKSDSVSLFKDFVVNGR